MKKAEKSIDICWSCQRESNSHWVTNTSPQHKVYFAYLFLNCWHSEKSNLRWFMLIFRINIRHTSAQTSVADMVSHMAQIWGHLTLKNSVEVKVGFYQGGGGGTCSRYNGFSTRWLTSQACFQSSIDMRSEPDSTQKWTLQMAGRPT